MKIVFDKNKTEHRRIGDIANFKRGYDLPAYARVDGEYPVMSSSGVSGYHNEFKKDGEGLVTGRYGTLGEFYYVNGKYWPHNTALYVTDFKGNYPKYVYFLMKSLSFLKRSDKSTVPGIDRNDLHEFKVPYIAGQQQKFIADALFLIEEKIELNKKINTELENLAKTIYNYWFVQFDFPNTEGKPYKTSGGEMEWNDELKREIPKGWSVQNLKENCLCEIIKPGIEYFDGEKIYLATADVNNLSINFNADKITYKNRESRANMQPKANSVWFAKMKNSRKIIFVGEYSNFLIDKMIFSTGFMGFACKKQSMEYILSFLINDDFEELKDRLANGATQQAINNDSLLFIPILIPNEMILKKFNNVMSSIFEKLYKNQIQSYELAKLRNFLLPLLMNGQVKVKSEAKEQLSMAAEPQVKYEK